MWILHYMSPLHDLYITGFVLNFFTFFVKSHEMTFATNVNIINWLLLWPQENVLSFQVTFTFMFNIIIIFTKNRYNFWPQSPWLWADTVIIYHNTEGTLDLHKPTGSSLVKCHTDIAWQILMQTEQKSWLSQSTGLHQREQKEKTVFIWSLVP